ncbi:MAG: hypothetical protein COB30_004595 [Ectothiorhodospiraceae bacterium]|nr:hypothetical protein [Ectothiorhodospiraceae bacterium]
MASNAAAVLSSDLITGHSHTQLPRTITWGVIFICVVPFLLTLMGADFGSDSKAFDPHTAGELNKGEMVDAMFYQLTGAFSHALLEWTAFCAALFTVVLAFSHYSITKDITTPIIGLALFFAGCMDAFHTLAAARLIEAVAPNNDLIPFTWAICRIFNALIMICGVGLFLVKGFSYQRLGKRFIFTVSVVFALVAYAIIAYCANSANLPQTQFPDAVITRPYDVVPLVLFLIAGLYLYPKLYRQVPNLFTHALIISAIPEVVVELHMAFGSSALFDNNFNIAHFLKIIAYAVPLLGLSLDYVRTYREEQEVTAELERSRARLDEKNKMVEHTNKELKSEVRMRKRAESALEVRAEALERSNKELREFAYVASHDLQEPLRMVASYTQLLSRRYKGRLDDDADEFIGFAVDGANRMQRLINDLLSYSRLDTQTKALSPMQLNDAYDWAVANLEMAISDSGSIVTRDDLPEVMGDMSQLGQLLQNLLGNAIKFRGEISPAIHVGATLIDGHWEISVKDNGIGIEKEFLERIFLIFQRLHQREAYEGTGIGLALCKKIVERHGGKINVESTPGEGSRFIFPLAQAENTETNAPEAIPDHT